MILQNNPRSVLYYLGLILAAFLALPSPVFADSSFLYTAGGQRIAKLSGEGDHTYYLPGVEVTVKPDGSLSSRKYYTFNGALVGIRDKSGISYTHSDQLGSAALTTDANGSLVGSAAYFPYGTTRGLSGTMAGERKYTGQVSDEDMTGLYYYNARYYSPTIGRFTQADSVNDGQNRYAYVENNPINVTDPTGHCEEWDYACLVALYESYYPSFGNPSGIIHLEVILPESQEPYRGAQQFASDVVAGPGGFFTEESINSEISQSYLLRIYQQTDFNANNEYDFIESLTSAVYENTDYNESELASMTARYHTTFEVIISGLGNCFDFAIMEHYILGQNGIWSEIVQSDELEHVFLRVNIDGVNYIVDPTWNRVWPETNYRIVYDLHEPFIPLGSLYDYTYDNILEFTNKNVDSMTKAP